MQQVCTTIEHQRDRRANQHRQRYIGKDIKSRSDFFYVWMSQNYTQATVGDVLAPHLWLRIDAPYFSCAKLAVGARNKLQKTTLQKAREIG